MNPNQQLKLRLEERRKSYSYCSACHGEISTSHILICAECLDDECNKFVSFYNVFDEEGELSE